MPALPGTVLGGFFRLNYIQCGEAGSFPLYPPNFPRFTQEEFCHQSLAVDGRTVQKWLAEMTIRSDGFALCP